mmetsp:Transcript_15548/g.36165  ORF Transcript_15548/g.36165 Transcript_15548/m.36165 type:complete len:255 (+) Transcript_15548:70-834(+)
MRTKTFARSIAGCSSSINATKRARSESASASSAMFTSHHSSTASFVRVDSRSTPASSSASTIGVNPVPAAAVERRRLIAAAGTPRISARDRARPLACLPAGGAVTAVPIGGSGWPGFRSACPSESTLSGATLAPFKLGNWLGFCSAACVGGALSEAEPGLEGDEGELALDGGTSSRMAPLNVVPTAPRNCWASALLIPPVSSQNLMFAIWRSQWLLLSQRGATKVASKLSPFDRACSTSAAFSRIHGTARSTGA